MKIIDAHAHIAQYVCGFTSNGELRSIGGGKAQYATGEIIQMFPPEMGDFGVAPEELLKVMDDNGVERAMLLQGNFLGFNNEYTYDALKKYPDRFSGAATYNPFCRNVGKIRKHLFGELGFKAVKFELSTGSGLMADRSVYIDGAVMNECFKHAADNDLTVILDIGRPHNDCWQIDALAAVVEKYPSVTFVICHLLAPQREDGELLKTALGKLVRDNVYFDFSSLAHNQKPETYPYPTAVEHLKAAKKIVGADKLMFGSDAPMNLTRESYKNLVNYAIVGGVFENDEIESAFYGTAKKIYFD